MINDESILALSWNIATEPKLYWELAPNPYSPHALQRISKRFPKTSTIDIIKAIVLADHEGRYDRNFRLLGAVQQKKELNKQKDITIKINKRLSKYWKIHAKELKSLTKELIFADLSQAVFETTDFKEIEKKYSQNQRRDFRLSIVEFIENTRKPKTPRLSLLKMTFAALSLIMLFYLIQRQIQIAPQHPQAKKVLAITDQKENKKLPVRLKIPRINVDAPVEHMGITPEGAMDVPGNNIDVGWYKLGPIPGETGSAVISGHFDGRIGESGVFNNLDKLKTGDKIYVINEIGTTTTFVVRKNRTYIPGPADEVFLPQDNGIHLNLITCDGVWDGTQKSYTKRLVVFADIAD